MPAARTHQGNTKRAPARALRHALQTALCLAALAATTPAAHAELSDAPSPGYVTNGYVSALAKHGDTIYLGGNFSLIGPATGPFGLIDPTTGEADAELPKVSGGAGWTGAVVEDGSGGWYVGGNFTHIGGVPRAGLAHILPDKSVDLDWTADVALGGDGRNGIRVLARGNDGTVYAGGKFGSISGALRQNLAALDPTTGAVRAWSPDPNESVSALAVAADGRLFVGGVFTQIAGAERKALAAFDTATGQATGWNPAPVGLSPAGQSVIAIALGGDGTVYVAGSFGAIGTNAAARHRLAALDPTTGAATGWNPNPDSFVNALAVGPTGLVYVGGFFTRIGADLLGPPRLAAIDPQTGNATGWRPEPTGKPDENSLLGEPGVFTIDFGADGTVYAGGWFEKIGTNSATRRYLAALNPTTGEATSWNPRPNWSVNELAVAADGRVAVGGNFNSLDATERHHLAAIRASYGALTDWAPEPAASTNPAHEQVYALAVAADGTVYAGGNFRTIGTNRAARRNLAALNPTTGEATGWNPNSNDWISDLALVSGGTLYAVGAFTAIGANSQSRDAIAALDTTTGNATSWDPNPNGGGSQTGHANGRGLAVGPDGTVYFSAGFTSIGTNQAARNNLAALDPQTGQATAWNPNPDGVVRAFAFSADGTIYTGGDFDRIGANAASRDDLAALDPASGNATGWNPDPDGQISPNHSALAVASDGTIYAGGEFQTIGTNDAERPYLAALDPTSGEALAWSPRPGGDVFALVASGDTLYTAGIFRTMELAPAWGFAAFGPPPSAPVNTAPPEIVGTPAVGETLGCSTGSWAAAPIYYSYAWLRDGTAIGGETRSSHTITSADAGHSLVCRVSAHNLGSSASADSGAVSVPGPPAPPPPPPPPPPPGGGGGSDPPPSDGSGGDPGTSPPPDGSAPATAPTEPVEPVERPDDPPAVERPPAVRVGLAARRSISLRELRRRGLFVRARPTLSGKVNLALRLPPVAARTGSARRVVIARASVTTVGGRVITIRLRPTKRLSRALRSRRLPLRATVLIESRDNTGRRVATARKPLTIR